MARQNFSMTIKDTCMFFRACKDHLVSTSVPTAVSTSETSSGTTRHKPTGFLNPTPYTFEKLRTDYQRGTCDYYPGSGSKHSTGQYFVGVVGGIGGTTRFNGDTHFNGACTVATAKLSGGLRNAALIAVRNNLKGADVNLGVAYGERNQTARLLGDTASRLARSVRKLRRGEIRNAMNELGISSKRRQPRGSNVPQRWLELQYGWKPLLSDVYGAADALNKRPKSDWRVTARATRKTQEVYTFKQQPGLGSNQGGGSCRASVMRSVYARLDALPQNEALISLASLGVTNPLSVGWELVPFSFVVDWALPIGNYLESLDALLGYGSAYYSSSLLVKADWRDVGLSASGGTWYNLNSYIGRRKLVYLSRETSSSVPLPTLPRLKDPRSLGHMANGLALLATAFGRR